MTLCVAPPYERTKARPRNSHAGWTGQTTGRTRFRAARLCQIECQNEEISLWGPERFSRLELGVDSPERIEIVAPDEESAAFAEQITPLLFPADEDLGLRPVGREWLSWARIKTS